MSPRNMDNFDSEDMALPELKLVQNVGGDAAKAAHFIPGDLYLPMMDEGFKEGLDVVVVDMQKTRTFWGRDVLDDGPPKCSSNNADTDIAMDGTDCKTCPNRCDTPWLLTPSDRRTKCMVNWNILTIQIANNLPMIIRTTGISTRAAKELFTQIRVNRAIRQLGLHRAIVHVSSEKKKTAGGEAYAFKFKVTGMVQNMAQAKELAMASTELLGTDMADLLPPGAPELIPALNEGETPAPPTDSQPPLAAQPAQPAKEVQTITKADVGKLPDLEF